MIAVETEVLGASALGWVRLSRYYKSSVENTYTRALPSSDAPKSAPSGGSSRPLVLFPPPPVPLVMVPEAPTHLLASL